MRFHLCKLPRVIEFIETESRLVVAGDWGRRDNWSYWIKGIGFQFGKMKRVFWRLVAQ